MLLLWVTSNTLALNLSTLLPTESALQPSGLLHTRGIAGSGFPPLSNIPTAASRRSLGPCLSSSVAGHPLRPATDRRLGRLYPTN